MRLKESTVTEKRDPGKFAHEFKRNSHSNNSREKRFASGGGDLGDSNV